MLEHVEVELKFPLHNEREVKQKLDVYGTYQKSETQIDTYYVPLHRNFLEATPISEWLRLRQTDRRGVFITYKKWHNEEGEAISCDESETTVGSADALQRILQCLDFREVVTVKKVRHTFKFKGALIAIDTVGSLGMFIELEADGDFPTVEDAKTHLYAVLHELGADVGDQDFEGYPHKLLRQAGLLKGEESE